MRGFTSSTVHHISINVVVSSLQSSLVVHMAGSKEGRRTRSTAPPSAWSRQGAQGSSQNPTTAGSSRSHSSSRIPRSNAPLPGHQASLPGPEWAKLPRNSAQQAREAGCSGRNSLPHQGTQTERCYETPRAPRPHTAGSESGTVPQGGSLAATEGHPSSHPPASFLARLHDLRPGKSEEQAWRDARQKERLRADLDKQVAEKKLARADQLAKRRQEERLQEAEIARYRQLVAAREEGGRADVPRATLVPKTATAPEESSLSKDGTARHDRQAGSSEAGSTVHTVFTPSASPHPSAAPSKVSSPLAALLQSIQGQQQSLQASIAAQAATVDRLEGALQSARR